MISDILEYTENNDALFSADFEQAFYSVVNKFKFSVLKSFGLGFQFIQWVKPFIESGESYVFNIDHSIGYLG